MKIRVLCIFCALCALIAVINLPIAYYTFLRIVLTTGAVCIILKGWKNLASIWMICFALIAILFNPIFPVYFGIKKIWIPIDIITGILFLLIDFKEDKSDTPKKTEKDSSPISMYKRDKIIKTTHLKNKN